MTYSEHSGPSGLRIISGKQISYIFLTIDFKHLTALRAKESSLMDGTGGYPKSKFTSKSNGPSGLRIISGLPKKEKFKGLPTNLIYFQTLRPFGPKNDLQMGNKWE